MSTEPSNLEHGRVKPTKAIAVILVGVLAAAMLGIGAWGCGGQDHPAGEWQLLPTLAPAATVPPTQSIAPISPTAEPAAIPPAPTAPPVPTAEPAATRPPPTAALEQDKDTGDTVAFADLNWNSARIQNRIAQYIIEHGYGYATGAVGGTTHELFGSLRRGDIDVTMEIWLPLQDRDWLAAVADGEVQYVGNSLGSDWQSTFVIPTYLQAEYPDLDHVDDLKELRFRELFATSESGGRARLIGCPSGWACQEINELQVSGYGLTDHIQIFQLDSQEAIYADVYAAYAKGKPWLGYMWGTADPAVLLELTPLDEPPYSDECWYTHKACAFQGTTIITAVNSGLSGRAPALIHLLEQWDFNLEHYRSLLRWMDDNDASLESAALHWLRMNGETWKYWVTEEAYAGVQAALDAGRSADGWPRR